MLYVRKNFEIKRNGINIEIENLCKYKQDKNKIEKKKYKSCIFCNKKIKEHMKSIFKEDVKNV